MKREDYKRRLEELRDPYSVWIRDREVRRAPEEFSAPEEYLVFSDEDGFIDEKASSAFRDYGAFSKGFDFIYTDEDEIADGIRHDPYFKSGFSPDTLDSFYYPGGFTVVRKSIADRVPHDMGFRYGSREFLRECALLSKDVLHIPEVLYHAFHRHGYEYDGKPQGKEDKGASERTAAVILSKDHPGLLEQCLRGLYRASEAEETDLECIVIDNGSSPSNEKEYLNLSRKYGFDYLLEETDFVYSRLCNLGAAKTKADLILFLNDDIEIPENTVFLRKMAAEAKKLRTGAVGCKLLYPEVNKIQHCGITLLKSGASHKLSGYSDDRDYYWGVNRIKRNVFAVTGACLMVERRKFEEAGGFDENLAVAYTDVDLCSALLTKGLFNVCLNDISLIHHESISRKSDSIDTGRFERLLKERDYYYKKYHDLTAGGDPWYNPNLTETGLDYSVNIPSDDDRIPYCEELPQVAFSDKGDRVIITEASGEGVYRKCGSSGKVYFSIDSCDRKMSDALCHEDFTEIRGWAFVHRSPGYKFDTFICVKDGERYFKIQTGRIQREDILQVFPGERDISLSGFSVKIKNSLLQAAISVDNVFLILERKDLFGRKRGYITI